MARSPSTNMNFWARAPLNLVADRVKNSVPPMLLTRRFCSRDRIQLCKLSGDHSGAASMGAQGRLEGGSGGRGPGVRGEHSVRGSEGCGLREAIVLLIYLALATGALLQGWGRTGQQKQAGTV